MTRILISAVFLMLASGSIADISARGREDFGFDLHMDMSGTEVTVTYMGETEFWRE